MNQEYITITFPTKALIEALKGPLAKAVIDELQRLEAERKPQNQPGELISRKQAAALLGGISMPTITKYIRNGTLKAVRVGGRVMFHKEEVIKACVPIKTALYSRPKTNH